MLRRANDSQSSMTVPSYDPTIEANGRNIYSAQRPKSISGLRVGLVYKSKLNSDQLLMLIASLLEREHGAKTHIMRRKKSAGIPPSPEIIDEFKAGCDVVVAGVGD